MQKSKLGRVSRTCENLAVGVQSILVMKHRIVADGAGRVQESTEFQARLWQLRDAIRERHADEFARAGFFRRLMLRWQMEREFRQERRKLVPSKGALYVLQVK
jgi:hypothetical protein